MTQQKLFTEGKIYSPLIRFTLPLLGTLFLQALYSAGDMLIIGLFGTTADVSAVSTGTGIIDLIRVLLSAFSIGTTVMLGQLIGANKQEAAGQVVGTSVWLFLILGTAFTLLLYLPAAFWAELLRAPTEAFDKTVLYTQICALGTIFVAIYNVQCSIFRGLGDSKTPLIIVSSTFLLNFIGDIFLVGYLRMGAGGSALTNVLAQALSVLLAIVVIRKQHLPFHFNRSMIRRDKAVLTELMNIGLPMALQDLLVTISFLVITGITNALGLIPSAGVGVAEKICMFVMLVPSAFGQAMSAFVAQNIGAQRPDRARKAMLYGMLTSLAAGFLIGYVSFFHGSYLASIFAKGKPEVIAAAADYLRAYAIDCLLTSFLFCFTGYFTGLGMTKFVMVEGIIGAFGVRIPVSFIMSRILPVSLFRVGLATPCSTILQIALCVWYYRRIRRNEKAVIGVN